MAFDPATWGRTRVPSGPLETARVAAHTKQQNRIRVNLTSNTTLVGLGPDARIVNAHVRVNNIQNVIIRNITFEDAFDCFPQWDPTDGALGNWNSSYDNISLTGATNVWVDHNAFNDGEHPDSAQPVYFGRPFVIHDGAVDITNASDLATVSWNRFDEHDKVMLIGSSDGATADVGKLRVTVHHNVFDSNVQRTPRVRFGQVHVYKQLLCRQVRDLRVQLGRGSPVADLRGEQLLRDRRDGRSVALHQPLQRHPDLHRRHAAQRTLAEVARRCAGGVQRRARSGSLECRDVDTVPGRRVPPDTGGSRRGQEYGRDVPRRIGAFSSLLSPSLLLRQG